MRDEQKRSVVIADDDDSMRLLIRLVLQEAGYRVVGEAADGETAVRAVARRRPDFIVLDEEMPSMLGSQAAAQIRAQDPNVRIVMCTNLLREGPREADATISKLDVTYLPLTLDRLAS